MPSRSRRQNRGRGGGGTGEGRNGGGNHDHPYRRNEALGRHVFDSACKACEDMIRMNITMDKIARMMLLPRGGDICSKLSSRKRFNIPRPEPTQETVDRYNEREKIRKERLNNLIAMTDKYLSDEHDQTWLDYWTIRRRKLEIQLNRVFPLFTSPFEKMEFDSQMRRYKIRKRDLEKDRRSAYKIIRGQCTRALLDKMKAHPNWQKVNDTKNDPLLLFELIEETIIGDPIDAESDICEALSLWKQGRRSNADWYSYFNRIVECKKRMKISFQPICALEDESNKVYRKPFDELAEEEKDKIREDLEERYLAFVFLRNSAPRFHLDYNLSNGSDDVYPKTRWDVMRLLNGFES